MILAYTGLLERQRAGELLSPQEQTTLIEYKAGLLEYFEKLSDNEKSLYYKNRAKWSARPGSVDIAAYRRKKMYFPEKEVNIPSTWLLQVYLVSSMGLLLLTSLVWRMKVLQWQFPC